MYSIASAGRTSTRIRASPSPALAKPCATPGGASTTSPGPRDERAQPEPEAHRARDDLEALGLDRMHVRDRDLAAGAQREVEREQLAAGAGGGVREREALAGDRVLERLAGSDHAQAPVAAVVRAYSPKSRGARPSARCTPSCGSALRPSSTSREEEGDELGLVLRHAGLEHPGRERVDGHRRRSAAARPVAAAISATASSKRSARGPVSS